MGNVTSFWLEKTKCEICVAGGDFGLITVRQVWYFIYCGVQCGVVLHCGKVCGILYIVVCNVVWCCTVVESVVSWDTIPHNFG